MSDLIKEARELMIDTTCGKWEALEACGSYDYKIQTTPSWIGRKITVALVTGEADARFIVRAKTLVPELVKLVDELNNIIAGNGITFKHGEMHVMQPVSLKARAEQAEKDRGEWKARAEEAEQEVKQLSGCNKTLEHNMRDVMASRDRWKERAENAEDKLAIVNKTIGRKNYIKCDFCAHNILGCGCTISTCLGFVFGYERFQEEENKHAWDN